MEEYINKLIEDGFILEDGTPLKCFCGSKDVDTKYYYGDGNYIIEEMKVCCKQCGEQVGYWSYGSWEM